MLREPPTIELGGIRLRPLRADDAAAWHAYLSDPQVTERTSYPAMTLTDVESMLHRVIDSNAAGASSKWAIATQSGDRLIGTCGFN